MPATTKTCDKCGNNKPLKSFYNDTNPTCRACLLFKDGRVAPSDSPALRKARKALAAKRREGFNPMEKTKGSRRIGTRVIPAQEVQRIRSRAEKLAPGRFAPTDIRAMQEFVRQVETVTNVLDEAQAIVDGPRRETYGIPMENHTRTAMMWSAYLKTPITPRQVCMLNVLQKISRDAYSPKHDNLVDIAGWARNAQLSTPSEFDDRD